MKFYDVYGLKNTELESARIAVEYALSVKFSAHESTYLGGEYYRFGKTGDEEFILQRNFNPFEEDWTEENFKEMVTLLYVNMTQRPNEIELKLNNEITDISLLKREVL